ncbi:low-density lipoprotein receptor class A domain-containing protein 4-like [Arapaima gigas]
MPEDSLQQGTCVWPLDSTATQPASEVRGGSPSLFHLDMCGTLDCPRTQKAATPSLGGDIKVTMCGLRSRERFPAQLFTQCDQPCRFQPTYPYLQHDIDLPPTISLSDGEEPPPYQGPCTLQLRDPEQQMELNRESVRAPPNRTVFDSDLIHVHSAGGLHPPSSHLGISASSGHADGPPPAYSEVMGKCQGSAFLPHQHNYTPLSQQGALKRTIQPSSSRSTMVSVKCGEGCDVKGGLGCLH